MKSEAEEDGRLPTSEEDLILASQTKYSHFPEPAARQLALLQGAYVTEAIHKDFAEHVAFGGNRKCEQAQAEITKKKSLPWAEYWHIIKGAKDFSKWKKAATDIGTPAEETEAATKVDEAGALAFLRFLHNRGDKEADPAATTGRTSGKGRQD